MSRPKTAFEPYPDQHVVYVQYVYTLSKILFAQFTKPYLILQNFQQPVYLYIHSPYQIELKLFYSELWLTLITADDPTENPSVAQLSPSLLNIMNILRNSI